MRDTYGFTVRLNKIAKEWQDGDLPTDGVWDEDYNFYVTGSGQVITHIHDFTQECVTRGCVIHAPSDHVMRGFPTFWRYDRLLMERTCDHGIGHPDPDDLSYRKTILTADEYKGWGIHGCDGCCGGGEGYEDGSDPRDDPEPHDPLDHWLPLARRRLFPSISTSVRSADIYRERELKLLHRAEAAEREAKTLREALRPFAQGAEAFDRADGTYGDGPVFERLTSGAKWSFTIADVRNARAALGSESE